MNKLIRDGKVGVLYSPGFGAGWSSWNDEDKAERLLFDPELIELVESFEGKIDVEKIKYLLNDDSINLDGAKQLKIKWVDESDKFYIYDYEGSEYITKNIEEVFTT